MLQIIWQLDNSYGPENAKETIAVSTFSPYQLRWRKETVRIFVSRPQNGRKLGGGGGVRNPTAYTGCAACIMNCPKYVHPVRSWRFKSSGMWDCIAKQVDTDVSKDRSAIIFRVKQPKAVQEDCFGLYNVQKKQFCYDSLSESLPYVKWDYFFPEHLRPRERKVHTSNLYAR
jgi:hypothetical protein